MKFKARTWKFGDNINTDLILPNVAFYLTPQEQFTVRPKIIHLTEVQGMAKTPFDVALVAVKSYDTLWATATGTSLTDFTVRLMVATAESTWPSLTLNVKLSGPL